MSEHHNKQNRQGSGGNNNRNRNNQNNRSRQRSRGPRKPRPLQLTRWQKFLKAIGLFNEEKARAKQQTNRPQPRTKQQATGDKSPPQKKEGARPHRKSDPNAVDSPRLYVGNLSFDANETDLEDLFKGIGTVRKVEIVYNKSTHRSKGYAFLNMQSIEEAKRAVEVLHDQPFMGRNLIVNAAKKRDEHKEFIPSEKEATPKQTEA